MQTKIYLTILRSICNLDIESKLNILLIKYYVLIISFYCVAKTLIIKLNKNLNFLLISKDCKLTLYC